MLVLLAALLAAPAPTTIALPGGEHGAGMDDLRFSRALGRVLVPGAGTGRLDLIDPRNNEVSFIAGFSQADSKEGHSHGITSCDEGRGVVACGDRTALKLDLVDAASRAIVAQADLKGAPDYVRIVGNEVWVTEPRLEGIEVFALDDHHARSTFFIPVPGGPESLAIDARRHRVYTHLWKAQSVAIDTRTHEVVSRWANGCLGSRGIDLDEEKGWLFAGCDEGKLVVLDVAHGGRKLSELQTPAQGVDLIAYDGKRVFLAGEKSATLAVVAVKAGGALALQTSVPTVEGAHCVTTDGNGAIFVCDPEHGQLLRYDLK